MFCSVSCSLVALAFAAAPAPAPSPATSPVGPRGGTVKLLHFAVTGDTRPARCSTDPAEYPAEVIRSIADAIKARDAQFAVDLGDHMNACDAAPENASRQMALYQGAVARFGRPWFMTMGNHECGAQQCRAGDNDARFAAFSKALAPVSALPYYSVDVTTSQGLATFVFVADNSWDPVQARWLEDTLARADQKARYTIVCRHHPPDNQTPPSNAEGAAIIRRHKLSLFMTGHLHTYAHLPSDSGRAMVMGTAGAPLFEGGFYGYAMVDQLPDGKLQVSVYDVAGDLLKDRWAVAPN